MAPQRGDIIKDTTGLRKLPFGSFFLDAEYRVFRAVGNGRFARWSHTVEPDDIRLPVKVLDVELPQT